MKIALLIISVWYGIVELLIPIDLFNSFYEFDDSQKPTGNLKS